MPNMTLVEAIATPHQSEARFATSFSDDERGLEFYSLFDTALAPFDPNGLIRFGEWRRLAADYNKNLSSPPLLMSGILHLHNYTFLENDALPVNPRRQEALIGQPLGWGQDYADWYVADHKLDKVILGKKSGNGIRSTLKTMIQRPLDKAIILSCPGHDIYGHWLIDMLPRLAMLRHLFVDDMPILLNFLPEWATYFLNALNIDIDRIRKHPSRCFEVERALVPTMSKAGHCLAPRLMQESWDLVLKFYDRKPLAASADAKVFLSRSRWGLREREFSDREALDSLMERRGYRVVHPQDHSVSEQIALMRSARVVIGEDGSALHNVVFCRPGATLGVLSTPERDNLYHLGLCQMRQHRVGYCPVPETLMGIDLEIQLNGFIDELERHADL